MFSPSQSIIAAAHRSVRGDNCEKLEYVRNFKRNVPIKLSLKLDGDETRVGTATICRHIDNETSPLQGEVHNCFLAHNNVSGLNSVHTAVIT